jgi:hypothetical protein
MQDERRRTPFRSNLFETATSKHAVALHEEIRTWLLVSLALSAAPLSAAAPDQRPPIAVSHARGPIVVDGDLSDAGWQGATKVVTCYETNPADNTEPGVVSTCHIAVRPGNGNSVVVPWYHGNKTDRTDGAPIGRARADRGSDGEADREGPEGAR